MTSLSRSVHHDVGPHTGLPRVSVGIPDRATHPATALLYFGRPAARAMIRARYLVRVQGASNVPARGPVILAGNHLGFLDGPLLALFSPRPAHVMTKIEMFDGLLGSLLRAVGQVPVDRFNVDPAAIRSAARVLDDGHALGIFPEGVRGAGDFRSTRPGAAYLALVTGAPVVPVAIFGTSHRGAGSHPLPPPNAAIELVFGSPLPIAPAPWPRTKQMVSGTHARLQAHLQEHLADARRSTGRQATEPEPVVGSR